MNCGDCAKPSGERAENANGEMNAGCGCGEKCGEGAGDKAGDCLEACGDCDCGNCCCGCWSALSIFTSPSAGCASVCGELDAVKELTVDKPAREVLRGACENLSGDT